MVDNEILRVENVSKSFNGNVALSDISLNLHRGEVLGLVGDNGAGKSTLIKILSGFQAPDSGQIYIDGQQVNLASVSAGQKLGIQTVYQDLALIDSLPVYLNLYLGKEKSKYAVLLKKSMRTGARQLLGQIGINIPSINSEVVSMSGGQRQSIAIARAVSEDARILLLDEPLAAMGAKEGRNILALIKRVKEERDTGIIMIVHNYTQVFEVCDRVNLLQHGEIVLDRETKGFSAEELLEIVATEYKLTE